MFHNKFPQVSAMACLLLITGCGGPEPEPPPPSSRPVRLFTVEGGSTEAVRSFPGRVDATQRAELGFRVGGQLQELLIKEGDLVEEGQVLARLDPTDYKIVLEDRQASYDNAARNFQRGQELIVDGNISRLDYDRMEAEFRTATAALSAAQQGRGLHRAGRPIPRPHRQPRGGKF